MSLEPMPFDGRVPEGDGASQKEADRARKRAEKERKRSEKAANKRARDAERAMLAEETIGQLCGFRVLSDGTIMKGSPGGNPVSSLLSLLPDAVRPRSPVVSVTFEDKRVRKPFVRARKVAGDFTDGVLGGGKDHFGGVSLTIATRDWVQVAEGRYPKEIAEVEALHKLLSELLDQSDSAEGSTTGESAEVQQNQFSDVRLLLRELKSLHQEGLITEEEYEAQRQGLLAHLPSPTQPTAPAGWHPDPRGEARLRWWDGQSWSHHTAP